MKAETIIWIILLFLAMIVDVIVFNKAIEDNNAWLVLGSAGAFTFTFFVIIIFTIAGD